MVCEHKQRVYYRVGLLAWHIERTNIISWIYNQDPILQFNFNNFKLATYYYTKNERLCQNCNTY